HYLTPALPLWVAGALTGVARLRALCARWCTAVRVMQLTQALLGTWLLVGVITCFVQGGLPGCRRFDSRFFLPDARTQAARRALALVPDGVSVQAPDALLPHLAERRFVHRQPPPERNAAWVIFDVSYRDAYRGREDLLRTVEEPVVRRWLARSDHGVQAYEAPYLLLRRGFAPRKGHARRYLRPGSRDPRRTAAAAHSLGRCLDLVAIATAKAHFTLTLRATAPCGADTALRYGVTGWGERTELLFDGLLSPAHLRPGDIVQSQHSWPRSGRQSQLWLGLVRASGARPQPQDPRTQRFRLPCRFGRCRPDFGLFGVDDRWVRRRLAHGGR
ncbi:MAG: DUF2079 domain-containing protein, partial [Polyangiales bacterium]